MSENSTKSDRKWHHPAEVMKLHRMKVRKKALQERIKGNALASNSSTNPHSDKTSTLENIIAAKKRKNPFTISKQEEKKTKQAVPVLEESSDQTLFKLLHNSPSNQSLNTSLTTSFDKVLNSLHQPEQIAIVRAQGEDWLPVDWSLKSKARLLSEKPFPWNNKLKISEETSGLISFARCLVSDTHATLDTSPNAKFHQCCLYWQFPHLPWLNLFPRLGSRASGTSNGAASVLMNSEIRRSLYDSWTDSLRSLFHLLRTRQCPYFYICANTFTVLFRAAGLNGFSEIHAIISPTTRGFRKLLKQEDIEFSMPLKKRRDSDMGYDTQDSTLSEIDSTGECSENHIPPDDDFDEDWLKSMGIDEKEIKRINSTQAKIEHKNECLVDNGKESLLLVEGIEVHPLYNFLINCKSAIATTGPLAGIPPTLLAPVTFNGATLQNLRVRQSKVHLDDADYHSVELSGPILPTLVHNLFTVCPTDANMSATFVSVPSTIPFSDVNVSHSQIKDTASQGSTIFGKENLSDSGLDPKVLKYFCMANEERITSLECIKYTSENKTFTWT